VGRAGTSFQILVAANRRINRVKARRMPAGLHGESACLRAGGRRFDFAPGQPGSSERCPPSYVAASQPERANEGGTTWCPGGSNPPVSPVPCRPNGMD
jgi:hypothetical protein